MRGGGSQQLSAAAAFFEVFFRLLDKDKIY
jgi:hypothetical protein